MFGSTVHCDAPNCSRWAWYDPDVDSQIPAGWVFLRLPHDVDKEFCSRGHAGEWLLSPQMKLATKGQT